MGRKFKGVRPRVKVYTDGAISKPHGPGGWECVMESNGHVKEFSGTKEVSTNSTLELEAVIQALWKLSRSCFVTVYSDSEYVVKAFTENRIKKWMSNGWRRSDGKPVVNRELWETLWALTEMHSVVFKHVKGHTGASDEHSLMNERADALARIASKRAKEEFGSATSKDSPQGSASDPGLSDEQSMSYSEARKKVRRSA